LLPRPWAGPLFAAWAVFAFSGPLVRVRSSHPPTSPGFGRLCLFFCRPFVAAKPPLLRFFGLRFVLVNLWAVYCPQVVQNFFTYFPLKKLIVLKTKKLTRKTKTHFPIIPTSVIGVFNHSFRASISPSSSQGPHFLIWASKV